MARGFETPPQPEEKGQRKERTGELKEYSWRLDWQAGQRPKGYVPTGDRIKRLKMEGADFNEVLRDDTIKEWNRLVEQLKEADSGVRPPQKVVDSVLELNKTMVEAMDAFEFGNADHGKAGWNGDWDYGERPRGYVSTGRRLQRLYREGYREPKGLREQTKKLFSKAREEGALSAKDVKQLLRVNQELIASMDDFEFGRKSEA